MRDAFDTFMKFCELMGVKLPAKKCCVGTTDTFLGLRGCFPCAANSSRLLVSLEEKKSDAWRSHLTEAIQSKKIERKALDKLVGRLSFAHTNVFGKFDRPISQELYNKLRYHPYSTHCDSHFMSNLNWRHGALSVRIARSVFSRPVHPDYIVYTDASWSDKKGSGRIAAILIDRNPAKMIEVLSPASPLSLVQLFKSSLAIYGLGLFALASAFAAWQQILAHHQVTAYVDNDPSSNGLVRGAAKFHIAHNMILRFRQLAHRRPIRVWLERAPSPTNIADLPTRGRSLPANALSWKDLPAPDFLVAHFTSRWSFLGDSSLNFLGGGG